MRLFCGNIFLRISKLITFFTFYEKEFSVFLLLKETKQVSWTQSGLFLKYHISLNKRLPLKNRHHWISAPCTGPYLAGTQGANVPQCTLMDFLIPNWPTRHKSNSGSLKTLAKVFLVDGNLGPSCSSLVRINIGFVDPSGDLHISSFRD